MARRKTGVIGALGNLFRWVIYALAAVLVLAVWLNWNKEEPVVAGGETVAEAPAAEETVVETPAQETVPPADDEAAGAAAAEAAGEAADAVEEAAAQVGEAVEAAEAAAADAVEQAAEAAEGVAADVAGQAAEAVETATEAAAGLAADVAAAASDAAEQVAGAPMSEAGEQASAALAEIRIPGTETTYSLLSAFRRDDGALEITTLRSEGGVSLYETRIVTCAPLATALVASGDTAEALGQRDDSVAPERITLGSAESLVAATACGAFK